MNQIRNLRNISRKESRKTQIENWTEKIIELSIDSGILKREN